MRCVFAALWQYIISGWDYVAGKPRQISHCRGFFRRFVGAVSTRYGVSKRPVEVIAPSSIFQISMVFSTSPFSSKFCEPATPS